MVTRRKGGWGVGQGEGGHLQGDGWELDFGDDHFIICADVTLTLYT